MSGGQTQWGRERESFCSAHKIGHCRNRKAASAAAPSAYKSSQCLCEIIQLTVAGWLRHTHPGQVVECACLGDKNKVQYEIHGMLCSSVLYYIILYSEIQNLRSKTFKVLKSVLYNFLINYKSKSDGIFCEKK